MSTAAVRWINGNKFIGTDSTNHSVVISTPAEGIGMKPSDLLLVALASCTAVDVVEILRKRRIELTTLEISAAADQQADPPWTFRSIHLTYRMRGKGLTADIAEMAVTLSEKKYCSVAATVRATANISIEIEILPEEDLIPVLAG